MRENNKNKLENLPEPVVESLDYLQSENESKIDNGLGILIKKKTLYHGSNIIGIKTFHKAEEDTVGSGIYFTSEPKDAIGYAKIRSERRRNSMSHVSPEDQDSVPVIYESLIENVKMCDLRVDENIKKVLIGFRKILKEEIIKSDIEWFRRGSLEQAIEKIDGRKIGAGNLKEIAQSNGKLFSGYIKSLGYDGLIVLEGGEGENGNHDTYLIFDTEKVKINQERKIL